MYTGTMLLCGSLDLVWCISYCSMKRKIEKSVKFGHARTWYLFHSFLCYHIHIYKYIRTQNTIFLPVWAVLHTCISSNYLYIFRKVNEFKSLAFITCNQLAASLKTPVIIIILPTNIHIYSGISIIIAWRKYFAPY